MSVKIGELAQRTGKTVTALRYYEEVGLIPPPGRTEGGYREYPPGMVERVRFIAQAQERGFSLEEIAAALGLHDAGKTPCEAVAQVVGEKIAVLDEEIARLQARRERLAQSLRLWECGSLPDSAYCPIMEDRHENNRR